MKKSFLIICLLAGIISIQSCKKDDPTSDPVVLNTIPEFYKEALEGEYGKTAPELVLIANGTSELYRPQDLDFHPTRPNELWIINRGTEAYGGSTITISNPGEPSQSYVYKKDGNAYHFMSLPSAMAFSNNGNWATSANVLDANHGGGTYTGPTLWTSDMSIYGIVGNPVTQTVNGSHLDMVHQSPYTMGIASEKDNVFWSFDGYYGNIIRYDFAVPHNPGGEDHTDAILRRYSEVTVKRDPDVPSHMAFDENKKWLYIVDGGNKRIIRMDITTGTFFSSLPPVNEVLAEYSKIKGVTWEVFTDAGFQKPCGIEVVANRLFVSDYETGNIICYDINTKGEIGRIITGEAGIMGLKLHNNHLWYVNATKNTCSMVNPK